MSGNDKEVVELIQRKLQVIKHECKMDKKLVSFLIGQKGDRIKTIIENSQLIKIDFDNAMANNTSGNEKVCYLYGNKDAIEDGLDYIDATQRLQQLIFSTNKEIEELQGRTDQVLQENGFYKDFDRRGNDFRKDNRDTADYRDTRNDRDNRNDFDRGNKDRNDRNDRGDRRNDKERNDRGRDRKDNKREIGRAHV